MPPEPIRQRMVSTALATWLMTVAMGRPGHAPVEPGDKQDIQHDVDKRGDDEEVERAFAVADSAQDVGAHVVDELRDHAEEVDLQVDGGPLQDLGRGGP